MFFPLDFRKILLIIFVIALPIISINIQRKPGESAWYMKPFTVAGSYVQFGYSKLVYVVRDTSQEYLNLLRIKKENRELHGKIAQLETELSRLDEIKHENERFSQLLDFKSHVPLELTAAQVIGYDLLSQYATIRINRGKDAGLQTGLAVVTPKGVVGTIFSVDKDFSRVLVLTDRYSVVDAIVERSRSRGIVEGRTPTTAQLKYLRRTDDVKPGDMIVTSGLDPILPAGFPIARVTKVEKKSFDISQSVEVEPMVDPTELEEVFVVRKVVKGL